MTAAIFAALLAASSVPSSMLGTWSSGSCSDADKLLVITPTTAKMGTSDSAAIAYAANDDGNGNGAIHWQAEGSVDNFVYDASNDRIIYNAQGYHMPGAVAYKRCSS